MTLAADSDRFLLTDSITLKATSNVGDAIALVHNGRTIAQEIGRDVTFEIDALLVGRGPIQLGAVAISSAAVGQEQVTAVSPVASNPLHLLIEGPISNRKKYENPPKSKKPTVFNAPRQRSGSTTTPLPGSGTSGVRPGRPR